MGRPGKKQEEAVKEALEHLYMARQALTPLIGRSGIAKNQLHILNYLLDEAVKHAETVHGSVHFDRTGERFASETE